MAASILAPKPLSSWTLCDSAGRAEIVEGGDLQFVIELRRPFWAQAGHAEDRQHALGNLGQEFFEHRQRAGLDQRGHLFREVLADPLDIRQRAVRIADNVGGRLGQVVDRTGGVAIGPDAERVGPLELQQVGDLLEDGGDFVIGHGYMCNSTTSLSCKT